MMNTLGLCEKAIDQWGRSRWFFIEDDCSDDAGVSEGVNFPCTIKCSPDKGLGIFATDSGDGLPSGTKLVSEFSIVCLAIGKHRQRVCTNCLKFGHTKVKVSNDCPDLYFCSHECLHEMDDLTTTCGTLITQVSS